MRYLEYHIFLVTLIRTVHFIPSQHTVKFSFFLKLRFILPFIYLDLGKFLFLSKYIKETLSTVIYGDLGTMKSGKGLYFSYSLFLKALEIFLIWPGFKKIIALSLLSGGNPNLKVPSTLSVCRDLSCVVLKFSFIPDCLACHLLWIAAV